MQGRVRTSHRIGDTSAFPQRAFSQTGPDFFGALPVITLHSRVKCCSMRSFGS